MSHRGHRLYTADMISTQPAQQFDRFDTTYSFIIIWLVDWGSDYMMDWVIYWSLWSLNGDTWLIRRNDSWDDHVIPNDNTQPYKPLICLRNVHLTMHPLSYDDFEGLRLIFCHPNMRERHNITQNQQSNHIVNKHVKNLQWTQDFGIVCLFDWLVDWFDELNAWLNAWLIDIWSKAKRLPW